MLAQLPTGAAVRKHGSEGKYASEKERKSLGARGDPEFGAWLAYASISVIDDRMTSSRTRTGIGPILAPDDMTANDHPPDRLTPQMAHGFACWCAPTRGAPDHCIPTFCGWLRRARFVRHGGCGGFGERGIMTTGNLDLDTFPKLLMHHSRERGERPAIREKSRGIWRTVTWRELAEEAAALAAALSARGLQRGAHVALLGDNRPRLYAAMCAAHWLGAIAVPLYQDAAADEIASPIAERESHPRRCREPGAGRQAARDPAALPDGSLHRLRQGRAACATTSSRELVSYDSLLAAGPGTRRREARLPAGRGRARQRRRIRPSCSSPRARPAPPRASSSPTPR